MLIKVTIRECATILASLRRWHSYPAARNADSIATGGGKHTPLDNSEIERLCERISKNGGNALPRPANNGAREEASQKSK